MPAQFVRNAPAVLVFALAVALTGCGDTKSPESKTKTPPKSQAEHPPHGSHGGHVFEATPEGFQRVRVEVVEDDDAKQVVAYLRAADLKDEVQSSAGEATMEITKKDGQKKTYRLKGEMKDGKTSHYSSSDPELSEAIDARGAEVVLRFELDGKRYNVKVEHVAH